ncbi:MAG: hypothetical protein P4M13_01575 [Alphaproteobacteria bacterium]|nr:hypothetical protein [Alphaproteobacteria bacterium]
MREPSPEDARQAAEYRAAERWVAERKSKLDPEQYEALQKSHGAIDNAAKVTGISPYLLGSIAYLESEGGNAKAVCGSSLGLFQMQRETSKNVMGRYGSEIAAALSKINNDGQYDYAIAVLEHRKKWQEKKTQTVMEPVFRHKYRHGKKYWVKSNKFRKATHTHTVDHYNDIIFDPYFNALLGAFLTKMNTAGKKLPANNTGNLVETYSMHLLGQRITNSPAHANESLADFLSADLLRAAQRMGKEMTKERADAIAKERILSNKLALGVNEGNGYNPTVGEAYAAMSKCLMGWKEKFTVQHEQFGYAPPLKPVIKKQVVKKVAKRHSYSRYPYHRNPRRRDPHHNKQCRHLTNHPHCPNRRSLNFHHGKTPHRGIIKYRPRIQHKRKEQGAVVYSPSMAPS